MRYTEKKRAAWKDRFGSIGLSIPGSRSTDAQHVEKFVKPGLVPPATSILTDRPVLQTKLTVMVIIIFFLRMQKTGATWLHDRDLSGFGLQLAALVPPGLSHPGQSQEERREG